MSKFDTTSFETPAESARLDACLDMAKAPDLSYERISRVRRNIVLRSEEKSNLFWKAFFQQLEPALLVTTLILGLIAGSSFTLPSDYDLGNGSIFDTQNSYGDS